MQTTTLKQISEKLNLIDIGEEPIIFLHSSLFQLGKINFSLNDLIDLLLNWVGVNGTLLMPSFSYQNDGNWYALETKGKTGVLTEHFRGIPGVLRSIHPIHSVSALGKHANYFTKEIESSSFGIKSTFHKLIEANAINVSLGANFIGGATYLHYSEESVLSPFRDFKDLNVKCFDSNNFLLPVNFKYFARRITSEGEYVNDWGKPLSDFIEKKLFIFDKIGDANFMYSRMLPSVRFLIEMLSSDAFYCAKFIEQK
jgi:aminoglycoside 3-N-acetyltransferase